MWRLEVALICMQQMLPYFHAAGHFNYAKSAHMYLQQMIKLENLLLASQYKRFVTDGGFTVRRSDKYLCGVWSDMTIEQVAPSGLLPPALDSPMGSLLAGICAYLTARLIRSLSCE